MKKVSGFFIELLLLNFAVQAQHTDDVSYKDGMIGFERDVAKNMFKYLNQIPHDYLLFFEISLNKKGVRSVKEIYSTPDSISNQVYKSIKDLSTNWTRNSKRFTNVIIPVFLKKDLIDAKITYEALSYNFGGIGYPKLRELTRCFLAPPVILIFSSPVR